MAAEYEELVSKVVIQIAQAKAALAELEKSAGQATQKIEGIGSKGNNAFTSLGGSLKRLAGTFGVVLTAGAVVSFIKRVGESTRQVGLLAARSGQAEKSVRALQNQFKSLGYSEAEANSTLENFTQSFANFAFKGEIGGLAQSFLSLGVNIMDANGKMKDMNDLLIQAGDAALSINGGDRVKAQQLMLSMGFSTAQADLATRADRRERMEQMKREAIASKEAAEKAEKLSGALNNLGTKLVDLVLQADKSFGIFDKATTVLEGLSKGITIAKTFLDTLGDIPSTLGKIIDDLKADFGPTWGTDDDGDTLTVDESGFVVRSNNLKPSKPPTGPTSEKTAGGRRLAEGVSATAGWARGLLNLIGKGEGGYESVNAGEYGKRQGKVEGLTGWTLGDIKKGQTLRKENGKTVREFNAVGKYQMIPDTFKAAQKWAGLPDNALFTPENQDKMAMALLQNKVKAVNDYIKGVKGATLEAALKALSMEWASFTDPDTGKSHYHGVQGNKARISLSDARAVLIQASAQYQGKSNDVRLADNQSSSETNTTINIYAPSNDAGDIAKETLKYLPRTSTYVSPMA